MGTVHLLDALRASRWLAGRARRHHRQGLRNDGQGRAFVEDDPLGGHDPYSASKAATELAVASMAASYFAPNGVAVATARAGNVIGGGDWAEDRLIPDLWRAIRAGAPLPLAPSAGDAAVAACAGAAVGLSPLCRAAGDRADDLPAALNFGPPPDERPDRRRDRGRDVRRDAIRRKAGCRPTGANPDEAQTLALDPALAMRSLGWRPRLQPAQALQWTADWYRAFDDGADPRRLAVAQIDAYEALA